VGEDIFLFAKTARPAPEYWDFFQGAKRLQLELNTPPSNADVKNEWSYTSPPPMP